MKSDSVPLPHVRFGPFEVDFETGEVRKHGLKLKLQEKPLRVLQALVEKPGKLVTREDLRSKLWPEDHYVDFDRNLTIAMNRLRTVLSDSADEPRYIETLPRRGYRFIYPLDGHDGHGLEAGATTPGEQVSSKGDAIFEGPAPPAPVVEEQVKAAARRRSGAWMAAAALAIILGTWYALLRTGAPAGELKQQRLTFNTSENNVGGNAISPDGKYLAYCDPAGVHLKLLSTGEERVIPRPASVSSTAEWSTPSWFPDGTQLLANTYESSPAGLQTTMWAISILGQSPRELRAGAFDGAVSPDGTRIAFLSPDTAQSRASMGPRSFERGIRFNGATLPYHEIWVMGSQGDNPQKVISGGNESFAMVTWSPNGQRLAYLTIRFTAGPFETSIKTCDLKGSNRTVVLSEPELYLNDFCWLRDGRMLFARQEWAPWGDFNLWQIGIDTQTGAAIGTPKRITRWGGESFIADLSASADGKRLALLKGRVHGQVYVGELAAEGARLSPPWRLTNDEADNYPWAWTPDSKAILFASGRNNETPGIFKQAIKQETAEPVVTGPQAVNVPRLSPDGKWILYLEHPKTPFRPSDPVLVMRVPVTGGVPQLVLEARKYENHDCARAPASFCVVIERSQDDNQLTITALDPLKGRGKVLRMVERNKATSPSLDTRLSPDGSTIAYLTRGTDTIHLFSLSGGSDRELTVKGWPGLSGIDWSLDGKGLYCGSFLGRVRTLLYVDLNGNARVLWNYKPQGGVLWGVPSLDGRYLAIEANVVTAEVWMLEGF